MHCQVQTSAHIMVQIGRLQIFYQRAIYLYRTGVYKYIAIFVYHCLLVLLSKASKVVYIFLKRHIIVYLSKHANGKAINFIFFQCIRL